jgi:RimJ/RimL family protein N-acetyltransferase
MTDNSEPHPQTGQPIGLPVDTTPAQRPGPVVLKGRYGRLEKLKAEHAADLWKAFGGHDQVWTYISTDGPFATEAEFAPFVAKRAAASDPYAYAIIDLADRAVGYLTLLRIEPEMRVIEVGHVLYSPHLQRTPLGTETQYLLARYVFETLPRRGVPRFATALLMKERFASISLPRAVTATMPGSRCSIVNGPPASAISSAGLRRRISIVRTSRKSVSGL